MIRRRRWKAYCVVAALAPVVFALPSGAAEGQQGGAPPRPAVTVAKAEMRDIRPARKFNGRVVAVDEVDLMARVTGFLAQRLFEEGQVVKTGSLLFVIDPAPFDAVVQQRAADVARAEAEAQNAKVQFERGRELLKTGNIPRSEVDKREADYGVTVAQVAQAKASLEAAKIDRSYTEITAPIDGRIGRSTYSLGALVGPSAQTLASVVKSDPVYVTFPVSGRQLLDVQRTISAEERRQTIARLNLADGTLYPEAGKPDFLDVRANPGTDTVTVRATFPNPQNILIPGQFVSVTVEGGKEMSAVVVPQSAMQLDQSGAYVLLVDGQDKVQVRRIQPGEASSGDAFAVIKEGLAAGDRVIVEGIQKVRPGDTVQAVEDVPPSASGR